VGVATLALLLAGLPWRTSDPAALGARLQALRSAPLDARVVSVSRDFLGTPYQVSPLGESRGVDADPLLRFDAVDCLTFVEETLALALAPDAQAVVPILNRLRYSTDEPDWQVRNHVMEAQWIPNAVAKGFLRDVTRQWGGARTRRVSKLLDARSWESKNGQALALDARARPMGEFSLDIIPAAAALGRLARVPSGTLAVVVRADRASLVTRVSHLGVLVQSKRGPLLRHASRSFGKVIDERVEAYLGRNLSYAPWTIEGVALFEPTEPPVRPVTALAAPPPDAGAGL
jgi:hypothetical protein